MATNEVPRGPISGYVVENMKRLRADRRWSLSELSEQMGRVGRPMLASGLHRLEQGKRRIDADDLIALAAALDVSPITLLLPYTAEGRVRLTAALEVEALVAWEWLRARRPLDVPEDGEEAMIRKTAFQGAALPPGVRRVDTHAALEEVLSALQESAKRKQRAGEEATGGEHPEAP